MQKSPFFNRQAPENLTHLTLLGAAKAILVETGILYKNAKALEEHFSNPEANASQFLSKGSTRSATVGDMLGAMLAADESIKEILESVLGPVKETTPSA